MSQLGRVAASDTEEEVDAVHLRSTFCAIGALMTLVLITSCSSREVIESNADAPEQAPWIHLPDTPNGSNIQVIQAAGDTVIGIDMAQPQASLSINFHEKQPAWKETSAAPFDGPLHGGLSTSAQAHALIGGTVCETKITVESDANCGTKTFEIAEFDPKSGEWKVLPVPPELKGTSSYLNVTDLAATDKTYMVVAGIFGESFSRLLVSKDTGEVLGRWKVAESAQVCSSSNTYVAVDEPPLGFSRDPSQIPAGPDGDSAVITVTARVLNERGATDLEFGIAADSRVTLRSYCGSSTLAVLPQDGTEVLTYSLSDGLPSARLKPKMPVSDVITANPLTAFSPLDGAVYVLDGERTTASPAVATGAVISGSEIGIVVSGYDKASGTSMWVYSPTQE